MNRDHEPLARNIVQTLPTSSTLSKLFYSIVELNELQPFKFIILQKKNV